MRHIHLIGIGGIGMSGIAQILLKKGNIISGSDLKATPITERLKSQGAKIFLGHNAKNITGADLVVYSSAIKPDNPEIQTAQNKHIPVIKRAQMLAQIMQDEIGIAIAGSHGKTTTTALTFHLLGQSGLSPSASIGGICRNFNDNSFVGEGRYFVAEADESDGTFLYYKPNYAIVTNIDYEHLDYYRGWQEIIETFRKFINTVKPEGMLFACKDDQNICQILKDYKGKFLTFGLNEDADIHTRNVRLDHFGSRYNLIYKSKNIGELELNIPGQHNVSNSLAVAALGVELGVNFKDIHKSFESFEGVQRRFQVKYNHNNILILDDYAHHPAEIRATLKAAKNLPYQRIIAIFQPHRYTRTKALLNEFSKCFDLANKIFITDIYAASEPVLEDISGNLLADKIKEYGHRDVKYLSKDRIVDAAIKIINSGDLVITLGAGDIGKLSDELAERFKK